MKTFLILLAVLPVFANSQIKIFNISLVDSTQSILYTGIDNVIRFAGVNQSKFTRKIEKGMLTYLLDNRIVARVSQPGDTAVIKLLDKNRVIFEQKFKIAEVPSLVATVGHLNDSIATISRLLMNPFLTVECLCYLKNDFRVISFEMTVHSAVESDFLLLSSTERFTDEQIRTIKDCKSGDKLYFDNIRAISPDSRTRKLPSFTITIK